MADSSDHDPTSKLPPVVAVVAEQFPLVGRLLGIDFGTKRLGLAVCNTEQTIASPVDNWTRQNLVQDGKRLQTIITDYRIIGLVVGLPVHMSGDEGGKAAEAREFGVWASGLCHLPVRYCDERYSSIIAEQQLVSAGLSPKKVKERLDKIAARILLQAYLDSPGRVSGDLTPANLRKNGLKKP